MLGEDVPLREKLSNTHLRVVLDARESEDLHSWEASLAYREALEVARQRLPHEHHLVTLREYMEMWRYSLSSGGSRACNEADVWNKYWRDRDEQNPISFIRHPFHSTVLVDTYLTDVRWEQGRYLATVVNAGAKTENVELPTTGKIYGISDLGLPNRTGGAKCPESEEFEHRWWAFSTDQLKGGTEFALFANGGTIGCFCELIKAHYYLSDHGGFYRVLALPGPSPLL